VVDRVEEGGKACLPALDLPGTVGAVFDAPAPSGDPALIEVHRIAVQLLDPYGTVLAAGWFRHGDTPGEALARVLVTAGTDPPVAVALADAIPLRSVRSMPRPAVSHGVLLHLLTLEYLAPPGLDLGAGRDATLDEAELTEVLAAWADGGRADPLGGQAGRAVMKVQRPGVYAVVMDGERVLLTQLDRSGRWTLPGGGIDLGEQPEVSLAREAYEETGLTLHDVRLAGVSTARWTGRAPDRVVEDFQAVQLLYTATAPTDVEPHVVEVGGSTSAVAWMRTDDVVGRPLTYVALSGLSLVGVTLPE